MSATLSASSTTRALLSILACVSMVTMASAHEFWIQPMKMTVHPGDLLSIKLMHGERFDGSPVPRDEHKIERYEFVDADGTTHALRGMNQSTTSYLRPETSGVVIYQTNHYENTLDADRFDAYLKEERLEHIIKERAELGEAEAIGREVYTRNSKSIIRVRDDPQSAAQIDTPIGLPLEIVIDQIDQPRAESAETGSVVTALILFQGKPISGLRVVATSEQNHSQLIELKTDALGYVNFQADHSGAWMISTLHIQRETNLDHADWESFWSSTTFEIDIQPGQ